jgi:hypothetical protein
MAPEGAADSTRLDEPIPGVTVSTPTSLPPLQVAAQGVMQANLQGVPLALTRGLVVERASGSPSMSLPPWVGILGSHRSTSGRVLSPETVYLSLYQNIAQPAGPEFQTYGLEHQAYGGSRLQKPMTITLGEGRMHTTPEDMSIMAQVQASILNKDLFLVSLDRLRLYQRSNSGKPISDNIILEAYDPATGALVWTNPRITVAHAIAATSAALASLPALAPVATAQVAPATAPAPVAPAPALAVAQPPAWFTNLRREADGFGLTGDNLVRYIVSKRAGVLVMAGIAQNEAEAMSMAHSEVLGLLGSTPATLATETPQAPAAPAPAPLDSPEAVAAAIGFSVPKARTAAASPAPARVHPAAPVGDLPEALGLEHLMIPEWRPKLNDRILKVIRESDNQKATAQQIRAGLGLPTGFAKGSDLERIGNALKRCLYRMEDLKLITAEGTTKSRTYRLI